MFFGFGPFFIWDLRRNFKRSLNGKTFIFDKEMSHLKSAQFNDNFNKSVHLKDFKNTEETSDVDVEPFGKLYQVNKTFICRKVSLPPHTTSKMTRSQKPNLSLPDASWRHANCAFVFEHYYNQHIIISISMHLHDSSELSPQLLKPSQTYFW